MPCTAAQTARYARHLALKEIGEEGQEKLFQASALLVGVGGLGSPAALYLAAAGVGRLGLIDNDTLDASNLQRQVLYSTEDLGRWKAQAAADRLISLNPDVRPDVIPGKLTPENGLALVAAYDVVLDCTDSLQTKALLNDLCVKAGTPLLHAGIREFFGQTITIIPGKSACYQCVFGAPPDDVPDDGPPRGPLGALPGIIGTVQATEAIKLILDLGNLLTDRLFTYDALSMSVRVIGVKRREDCPCCG
ncbi:MAG: HesA/MoeB/ThiF family protein [Lentisphaerae bacterium]|jgi:molybdopterin-synthase adenylyltransferase|nr:HesA/MoeB/ThiF family protein [Lentisphaerota bacterium]MBT4818604.1 HesA/MoeB/ThiF family protein [Lentisphaerota bacterium]MBT5605698.1 HesA/MoeB/ThiF family protein [Lentisphaerota bacterium]MBT7060512.1 HesA/MoeB/ThiF family protein [Lentisphaerota bacterium]MBT7844419.1 HesA/MoeB/ThiF family protein [Lentisphaerota bacterium]